MPAYHIVSVTLDLYGIIICVILIWCLQRGVVGRKKLNHAFRQMCFFNILAYLGDLPNWLCEGFERPWYPLALWAGCLVLYLGAFFLLLAYTRYVIYYLEPKVRVHKAFTRAVAAIAAIYIICALVSQFNGMFYWIDSSNVYHRGEWYLFSQLLVVLILLIDTFIVIAYRRYLRKKEILAFGGYIILPIAAVIVQFFCYGLSLSYTASTIAILVIFIDIQSEQALLVEQVEKKLLQGRLSMLLCQIQPHFLYNSLTAIANLCTEDAALAKDKLIDFTHYLRGNMDSITKEGLIPFEQELEHTRFYLSMEQLRFEERLRVEYCLGPVGFVIPPLTLQPMVENAVRHGTSRRASGGTVIIGTEETEAFYLVTIEDDGPGFDTENVSLRDGIRHVGIYNVQHRLQYLCQGTMELQSEQGKGTKVIIRLPKRSEKDEDYSGGR